MRRTSGNQHVYRRRDTWQTEAAFHLKADVKTLTDAHPSSRLPHSFFTNYNTDNQSSSQRGATVGTFAGAVAVAGAHGAAMFISSHAATSARSRPTTATAP
ncbi:hypothetical protein J7T55_013507 [Diaporthe amygdali]|uniref:uncharacterized protein n=1 Tax=Phomopsis amygdali TaxID=1214568 RepID=UPI0022FF0BB1|nr:uncharacterized protein J7T55_013507 [Diaporthe amygdali]KAJ0119270.1 hypothetical protein J7T55_013507 [Diaporthe amygdali]